MIHNSAAILRHTKKSYNLYLPWYTIQQQFWSMQRRVMIYICHDIHFSSKISGSVSLVSISTCKFARRSCFVLLTAGNWTAFGVTSSDMTFIPRLVKIPTLVQLLLRRKQTHKGANIYSEIVLKYTYFSFVFKEYTNHRLPCEGLWHDNQFPATRNIFRKRPVREPKHTSSVLVPFLAI